MFPFSSKFSIPIPSPLLSFLSNKNKEVLHDHSLNLKKISTKRKQKYTKAYHPEIITGNSLCVYTYTWSRIINPD